jgi:hypothetical protein
MRKVEFIGAVLAAALIGSAVANPAIAKDKPAAGDTVGEKAMPALAAVQAAITKKDFAAALAAIDKAKATATSPYEKFLVGQFRAVAASNLKDNAQVMAGLDEAVDSGYTKPPVDDFAYRSGLLAYQSGDYNKAITRLTYAQKIGNQSTDIPLVTADSYYKAKRAAEGLAYVDSIYQADQAAKRPTSQDLLGRAAQATLDAKLTSETNKWLLRMVSNNPAPATWHDLLVIYRDQHPALSGSALMDLYRLMKATHSFKGAREIEEYATVALDKKGVPGEAKAAFDDEPGIAMTKTMTEIKNIATAKAATDHAALPNYIKQSIAAPTGKVARGTADALFGFKEYPKAIEMYQLAQKKGGVEPRVINMGLGESYALSGDKASARTAFAAVDGESADIAKFWMLWLDLGK